MLPRYREADSMLLLAGFSAFAVFLGIASIGFLFLLVSLLFGEFFGHGDLAGHDADFHGDVHGGGGVSIFSSRVLSVFVTAFGGFGAIGIHLGYGTEVSTARPPLSGSFQRVPEQEPGSGGQLRFNRCARRTASPDTGGVFAKILLGELEVVPLFPRET